MDCSPPGPSSMGFSRQEYWSGLPCPPPGDLPHQGSNPLLLHCRQILHCWATGEMHVCVCSPCGCSPCVCVWSWYMCVCIHYIYICVYISERHTFLFPTKWASPVAQMVKNMPAMQETWVWSLCQEDPLEMGMITHCRILAWRIPRTEEPTELLCCSMGLQRVRDNWVTSTFIYKMKPHLSSLVFQASWGYVRVFLPLLFYYLLCPTNTTELPFLSSSLT